jgi:hypothetical protein
MSLIYVFKIILSHYSLTCLQKQARNSENDDRLINNLFLDFLSLHKHFHYYTLAFVSSLLTHKYHFDRLTYY